MTERPEGLPFSKLYARPTKPVSDSKRARTRLKAAFDRLNVNERELVRALALHCGITVKYGYDCYLFNSFIENAGIPDLLDFVTLCSKHLMPYSPAADDWLAFVEKVFREEGLPYTVDQKGGVHHYVDEEFRQSINLVLKGLDGGRWSAALASFKEGLTALDKGPADNLQAVRRVFDACENVFKQQFGTSRLGKTEVTKHLIPKLQSKLSGANLNASKLYAASFAEWANALHNFRHADGEPEPQAPDDQLTIALFTAGAGYLRWLVGLAEEA